MKSTLIERLRLIERSDSYAESIMEAYGSLPKGQLWTDIADIILLLTSLENIKRILNQ